MTIIEQNTMYAIQSIARSLKKIADALTEDSKAAKIAEVRARQHETGQAIMAALAKTRAAS